MFNFKHLKLKVYRFLAKFIPYFKRKLYKGMTDNDLKQFRIDIQNAITSLQTNINEDENHYMVTDLYTSLEKSLDRVIFDIDRTLKLKPRIIEESEQCAKRNDEIDNIIKDYKTFKESFSNKK